MTDGPEHEADAPEQDIPSDAAELLHEEAATEPEAAQSDDDTQVAANPPEPDEASAAEDDVDDSEPASNRPAPKLERLQKILAQAGVASRRHAEEMITQGRVQVNGKVVSLLGSKADAGRDHIRVDGKLLHGAERLRYFMLNKPKGFVTTVKDPEGRSTVMEFFAKMPERLYPVGRLDYQSEGLLLMTNDGELANKLTKAASGVEKTYLVKVAGQPTEAELDILRGGVSIERGKIGQGNRVRTAPARIRQVRQGDNPWYEVVLIEGRNRELRKMFEEVGHFVEKIRRVGYGPLVLDLEPGQLRELDLEELNKLRLAADGKLRTPKAKELRRRNALDAQLPTLPPRASRPRPATSPIEDRPAANTPEFRPKKFGADRPYRPPFGAAAGSAARPAWKKDDRPARTTSRPPARSEENREGVWKKDSSAPRTFNARPSSGKPAWNKPAAGPRSGPPRTGASRSGPPRSGSSRPSFAPRGDRPAFNRPSPPRREAPPPAEDFTKRPPRLHIEPVEPGKQEFTPRPRPTFDRGKPARPASTRPPFDRAASDRPRADKPKFDRPRADRPRPDRPKFDRPSFDRPPSDRPRTDKPRFDRSASGSSSTDRPRFDRSGSGRTGDAGRSAPNRSGTGRSSSTRPFRSEGGLARPFTTSTGKPRPGGARPNNKSGGRPSGPGSRPGTGRGSAPRPAGKTGWKPKPSGGAKRSGPRQGGKKPGGPPRGKKRG